MSDAALAELRTLRDLIRWGASRLNEAEAHFGHGTDDAIDEAAALALHALHLPPDLHPDYLPARLIEAERQAVLALLARRIDERIPTPYLTGCAWFAGRAYYVDERVLIPRSPLAELIERHFAPWLDHEPRHIIDIGTGSGCIGLACAHAFPGAQVDLVDISADALDVAEENIARHGLEDRVRLIQSDVFAALDANAQYDLIISNPPYVSEDEMATLPDEYDHEPRLALAAGTDGLDVVRRMLAQAPRHLKPGGWLVVEVGATRHALEAAFPNQPFCWVDFEHGGEGVFLLDHAGLSA